MNYQHHSVELQCSSTDDSITIQLPSTGDSPDWALNLDFIIKAIANKFKPKWLFTINDIMINPNDPSQFGVLLSQQIPPPAILKIISLEEVTSLQATPKHTDDGLINEILGDMTTEEVHALNGPTSNPDFKLSWNHLIECIKHEMWPKLASVIQAMVNNDDEKQNGMIDADDVSDDCVRNIIDVLKTKRHLPSEECEYLKQLIARAKQFDPNKYNHYINANEDNHPIMDIYDVHHIFMFTNFNFREYKMNDFKTNVAQAFGQKWNENASFKPRFNLYPVYIVDDDIFRVLEYHFGVSCFVNTLKHNLFIQTNKHFEVQCIVIPQSVSCVYDDHMVSCDSIGTIESYLVIQAQITDFYKTRFKSKTVKHPIDIARKIEDLYGMDDIIKDQTSKLMIIIDRRSSVKQIEYDSMYIFPYQNNDGFAELKAKYFVCFYFKIMRNIGIHNNNRNKVMAYFSFGLNGITRFFPQMLVSIMPRFFRKPHHLSEAEYLRKLYHNAFKNGWCVTLEDHIFECNYKRITTFTHTAVNYNRTVLYDEFHKHQPMLCFTDLLYHEMQSNGAFHANDIREIHSFLNDNEYCTESIVDDVWIRPNEANHGSNIEIAMLSRQQAIQFEVIRGIVHQYNEPAPQHKPKICSIDNVFRVDQCALIQTIIDGLKLFHKEKMGGKIKGKIHINISDLLGAYDHMVSVHGFWLRNHSESHQSTAILPEESKSFEEIEHSQNISKAQRYIIDAIGGYCTSKSCIMLRRHVKRRREREDTTQHDDEHGGLDEILYATLNALHCYIAHDKKELFRLKRENGNSHFITAILDDHDDESEENKTANAMPNLNLGQSVLQWLDHTEEARFADFHDEMIHNPDSTIDEQVFLVYAQECYIKMNHRKYEQYLLKELMGLKIYTDTDKFQSALRKAHWDHPSTKNMKKCFYHWAMVLYQTALFHSKPIGRYTDQHKAPRRLYHGLNRVFVLDKYRPKYNGPTSTSLERSVAHSFSKGTGLLLDIKPSYANKFKFITGMSVAWISQHTNEAEVLLVNQYLPITASVNFDADPKNNVDHLLYTIKSYKTDIVNARRLCRMLGIAFTSAWIPFIETHHVLYDPIDSDPSVRVLDVLVERLRIKALYGKHKVLSSKFECVTDYKMFSYRLFRLNINHRYSAQTMDRSQYQDTMIKVHFDDGCATLFCKYDEPLMLNAGA
eukprot:791352_1